MHLQQIVDAPEFLTEVDRQRAAELGLTEQEVANQLNVSLSGSFQVAPNFWTDPKTGIPWQLTVQTPEYRLDHLADVANTPLSPAPAASPGAAGQPAQQRRHLPPRQRAVGASHVNTEPTYDIYAAVQDRDLGSAAAEINRVVRDEQKHLRRRTASSCAARSRA